MRGEGSRLGRGGLVLGAPSWGSLWKPEQSVSVIAAAGRPAQRPEEDRPQQEEGACCPDDSLPRAGRASGGGPDLPLLLFWHSEPVLRGCVYTAATPSALAALTTRPDYGLVSKASGFVLYLCVVSAPSLCSPGTI